MLEYIQVAPTTRGAPLPMPAAPPAALRPLSVRAAPRTTPCRSHVTAVHECLLRMASQARCLCRQRARAERQSTRSSHQETAAALTA